MKVCKCEELFRTFQIAHFALKEHPKPLLCVFVLTGYTEKHKKEITMLSTSANIVSKYTSYVGVDKERPDKISGKMKKRNVPIAPKKVRAVIHT